ncbi:penicillin-binding protein 2 [Sphingomonadales bacterium 56]|uniref:peptidoglycan D,D-transpeptidase FtsI family protein n=1 Tax=unclassified Sphingobium TaxID=2611147 RepID=UPI001919592B|nr:MULTISPECIES: penicillin-binding protein 2 [unclassified Sphingobium]MBY2928480.1 penicillin-binding protein 2 [Sphingomonadales bacterium 56]MBY2959672.1 penicillin-binding protein 2 [Sphingomonadales bacterium 58]CAD7337395.1 putative peptidoglycan D,D-transpeptidase FtsI [Sphingobium sp. S6]CAD7339463.1 putative peptidoglycan D,D-transpeptidase FtsI [Sphingobium sp. S8]
MATIIVQPGGARAGKQRVDLTAVAHNRLMLLLILFMAITAVVILRLTWVGIFAHGASGNGDASGFLPVRADIVDRNGVPLARTMDAYSIAVRPSKLIGEPAELARKLHEIFPDEPEAAFYKKLTGRGWAYLRRRALPEEVAAVNALGEIGIEFPREKERLYPQRSLAAHVLGFAPNADGQGGMGVEAAFNERLTDSALRGQPFAISIDSRVQGALESELYAQMVAQNAKGAGGIIMDANTGELIAMASIPVFDPNKLQNYAGKKCSESPLCNHMVQARYELGSTFKPLSIAAAMDRGVVTSMAKRYDATAPLAVAGFRIKDDHSLGRWINVPEILVHSSNIGTARIADEMGAAPMQQLFRNLQFDQRAPIELKERAKSLWPYNWGRITTMTVSYGHGIAVTPLHLATAYAALVNGGIWRPATLRKLHANEVPEGHRVFSAATSARMRQLLRMIVAAGTGRSADAKGFRVGGKTGSAEKPEEGRYNKSSLVTTFASAFPMDNPRYVVLTMMDEPKGNAQTFGLRTAAWTAAPVVKRVVERTAPMLGVLPDERRDVDISDLMPLLGQKEKH